MRSRVSLFAVVLAGSAFAGGVGASAAVPARPGPSWQQSVRPQSVLAVATPSPKPTPVVYPLAAGDQFTYAYEQQSTTTTGSKTQITSSYKGTETATLSGLGSYNGLPAYQLRTTGTSGYASLDNIDYVNLDISGGRTRYVEYGYYHTAKFNLGSSVYRYYNTKLTYASPFIFDILPDTAGSGWPEPVGIDETVNNYYTSSSNNPNILSGSLIRAADGSYRASGKQYDVPITRIVKPDGSGSVVQGPASGAVEWAYALPQIVGSKEVIPATETYASKTHTNLVPDWYPGAAAPRTPLAVETMHDLGKVAAPSTCGARAGTLAFHLESVFSQLDPVAGFTDSDVQDFYVVPGLGKICLIDHDTQTNHDTENTGGVTSIDRTDSSQVLISEVLK
jgi:hypothetical protein